MPKLLFIPFIAVITNIGNTIISSLDNSYKTIASIRLYSEVLRF